MGTSAWITKLQMAGISPDPASTTPTEVAELADAHPPFGGQAFEGRVEKSTCPPIGGVGVQVPPSASKAFE